MALRFFSTCSVKNLKLFKILPKHSIACTSTTTRISKKNLLFNKICQLALGCRSAYMSHAGIFAICHAALKAIQPSLKKAVNDFTLSIIKLQLGIMPPKTRLTHDVCQQIVGAMKRLGHAVQKPQHPFCDIAIPPVCFFQDSIVRSSIRHYL